jgi:DNA replication protein DnaC
MAPSQLTQEAAHHLALVTPDNHTAGPTRTRLDEELRMAPLFTSLAARAIEAQAGQQINEQNKRRFHQQHGLLGLRLLSTNAANDRADINQLVYTNVSAPWSAFICGSQGSGKSHTLSCLLENALIAPSPAGSLSSPLAGLVLHYDKFTAFSSTQLCEAAYLCSSGIPVRVFVSPTNFYAMKEAYEKLPGLGGAARKFLRVVPMYLSQKDLNISMMKTLMGVGGESQPLYIEVCTGVGIQVQGSG